MKMLATFAALCPATAGLAGPAEAQLNHRQHDQQEPIAQGVESGALTQRETYRLKRNQGRIDRSLPGCLRPGGVPQATRSRKT
jgi:hypothetical protein